VDHEADGPGEVDDSEGADGLADGWASSPYEDDDHDHEGADIEDWDVGGEDVEVEPVAPSARGCVRAGLLGLALMVGIGAALGGCLVFATHQVGRQIPKQKGAARSDDYALTDVRCRNVGTITQVSGRVRNTRSTQQGYRLFYRFSGKGDRRTSESFVDTGILQPDRSARFAITSELMHYVPNPVCRLIRVDYSTESPLPND
jgi:hypothetical protein